MQDADINLKMLEDTKSIMQEKLGTMIEYFLEDTITYIENMKQDITKQNLENLKLSAHSIKSSAKQLGADKVSEISKQIEILVRKLIEKEETDFNKVLPLFEQLQLIFATAQEKLNIYKNNL